LTPITQCDSAETGGFMGILHGLPQILTGERIGASEACGIYFPSNFIIASG
jgi:hypothetical protein